jgi:phosphatidylglycerophosphate synthase
LALLGIIAGLYGWSTRTFIFVDTGLVLLIASAITDLLDGITARRLSCVSDYGGLLDTTQDKVFIVVVFSSCLLPLAQTDNYHACFLLVFLIINIWRDYHVMMLRCLGAKKGLSGHARWFGKVRTASLMFFGCYLFSFAFDSPTVNYLSPQLARNICFVAEALLAALTIATWFAYTRLYNSQP